MSQKNRKRRRPSGPHGGAGRRTADEIGDVGWRRPQLGSAARIAWTVSASALVLAITAAGAWFPLPSQHAALVTTGAMVVAGVLALGAAWWLGSTMPGFLITAVGVLVLGAVGPLAATDEVLAHSGHEVVATVSKVDSTPDRQSIDYTVWFTDSDGRPIAQPLYTYGPPPPLPKGETIEVVADPEGRVPTETPDRLDDDQWAPPVTVVAALLVVAGLVIAAVPPRRPVYRPSSR